MALSLADFTNLATASAAVVGLKWLRDGLTAWRTQQGAELARTVMRALVNFRTIITDHGLIFVYEPEADEDPQHGAGDLIRQIRSARTELEAVAVEAEIRWGEARRITRVLDMYDQIRRNALDPFVTDELAHDARRLESQYRITQHDVLSTQLTARVTEATHWYGIAFDAGDELDRRGRKLRKQRRKEFIADQRNAGP